MCAMSPRLLRPRASGFSPKNITGLALWLDASDSSYNATTGTWADKSGGGRDATQPTAASRPTVGTLNSKPALLFDGSNDHLLLGNIASAFPSAATLFVVCRQHPTSPETSWASFSTGASSWDIYNGAVSYAGVFRSPRVSALRSIIPYQTNPHQGSSFIIRYRSSSSAYGQFVNGAVSFTASPAYNAGPVNAAGYVVGGDITAGTLNGPFKGTMCEVLAYSRELSDAECARVEQWLAAKWDAALGPSVSNPDAQDWIRRVYLNNGTVSASTASAVNTFCNDIDTAGIRDRFYRLNLFAGTGLNACLVPLYRGPSRTGTQYGNTTDTNVNFVSGDYVETGASGGLVGNGTNKRLDTGLNGSELSPGNRHLSAYEIVNATTDYSPAIVSGNSLATMHGLGPWTNSATIAYRTFNAVGGNVTAAKNTGYWLGNDTSTTASVLYRNGSSVASTSGQNAGGSGNTIYRILGTPDGEFSEARIGGYTIGLGVTAGQVTSLYNAMQAFQTALTRNV